MVEEIAKIKEFLQDAAYLAEAQKLVEQVGKHLYPDLHDAEVEYCKKCLKAAKLSLSDISELLAKERKRFEEFCLQLIRTEKSRETGQEYNPSEPEEKEEENETYLGHSRTFLLTSAMLFIIIHDRRPQFSAYLKAIRQPKAVEYQRGVEAVFDEVV